MLYSWCFHGVFISSLSFESLKSWTWKGTNIEWNVQFPSCEPCMNNILKLVQNMKDLAIHTARVSWVVKWTYVRCKQDIRGCINWLCTLHFDSKIWTVTLPRKNKEIEGIKKLFLPNPAKCGWQPRNKIVFQLPATQTPHQICTTMRSFNRTGLFHVFLSVASAKLQYIINHYSTYTTEPQPTKKGSRKDLFFFATTIWSAQIHLNTTTAWQFPRLPRRFLAILTPNVKE